MRDVDIRRAVVAALRSQRERDPRTLIRHELGVCAGRCRVDVAVINKSLTGFEIKSDKDTLTRLPRQVAAYNSVLDFASLVTVERHLPAAPDILPPWWGVLVAREDTAGARLATHRAAARNAHVAPFAVAQLLWRDEAMAALRARGLHHGLSRARRWHVWQRLASSVPLEDLQTIARRTLTTRQDWPGGQ